MLMLDNFPSIDPLLEAFAKPQKKDITSREPAGPKLWFHSQTLPLLHFTLSETRFLLPVSSDFMLLVYLFENFMPLIANGSLFMSPSHLCISLPLQLPAFLRQSKRLRLVKFSISTG